MDKNKRIKQMPQFIGLFLCIVLIQTACATEDQLTADIIDNSSFLNETFENSTIENVTIENPIENVTSNFIDPSYYYTYVTAGYSTEFTVSFTNNGNENLVITPKVIGIPETRSLNESWITISPANATVAPGSVEYFTIEENIPWDEVEGYNVNKIVFTDDIAPYSGYYDDVEYVDQMYLYTYVYASPKIELQTSYISDTVDAGTENVYRIKIKNVAPRDLTLNPILSTYSDYYYYSIDSKQAFGDDAIKIDAPSTLKSGEIANMTITVNVPENASGVYSKSIDMNVNGKVNDNSVPRLNLQFNVWKAPAPFVKTFYTSTEDPITIEVSGDMYSYERGYRISQKKDKPPFELGLTCNSIPVNMNFEESGESGGADIQNDYYYYYYPSWANEYETNYYNVRDHYAATYKVPGAVGEWQLSILPKGARNFQYSIKIKENNQEETWNITSNVTSNNTSIENSLAEEIANEDISTDATEENLEMPVADFKSDVVTGSVPLSVQFTDLSKNASEWNWNFGDGIHSTIKNPEHIYSKAGKYTVSLTVKNEKGSDTEMKYKYLSVSKK